MPKLRPGRRVIAVAPAVIDLDLQVAAFHPRYGSSTPDTQIIDQFNTITAVEHREISTEFQHQTADIGKVPNDVLQNAFMAVAIDTYDADSPHTPIHPRYKQIVAERLSFSGLNIAYGKDEFPTNGPFIESIGFAGKSLIGITYDQDITYDEIRQRQFERNEQTTKRPNEISGFYYCCVQYDFCDNENWMEVERIFDSGHNYVS